MYSLLVKQMKSNPCSARPCNLLQKKGRNNRHEVQHTVGCPSFCRIRVRSVWSVRSSSCVSRGGGAVQSRCGRRQSGQDHKFQCSCSVPLQPRSCPRSGLPSSSFTSMQTPHGFLGRGCGASPSGILRRGIVCRTIGPLHGRGRARSGRRDGRCLAVAAGPCVLLVPRLCMLVVDEEAIIRAAFVGCLLCFLCVYMDAVL